MQGGSTRERTNERRGIILGSFLERGEGRCKEWGGKDGKEKEGLRPLRGVGVGLEQMRFPRIPQTLPRTQSPSRSLLGTQQGSRKPETLEEAEGEEKEESLGNQAGNGAGVQEAQTAVQLVKKELEIKK